MAQNSYSFMDCNASIVGPGGAFSLGNGACAAEEGISITASQDISSMTMGADGSGVHSLHADKSGKLSVRLLKTSPVNALLAAMYAFQTANSANHGQNVITLLDTARGDVITCTSVAFAKAPDLNYQKEAGTNEWTFNAIRIDRLLGRG
jgi:hypothetical protein